jgi:dTDP-glucose 4,6-dehydratase
MTTSKIFLTGVTGFIGSHLVEKLVDDYEVVCLVPSSDLGSKKIHKDVEIKFGDLTNYSEIQKIVREISPNMIVHLAAVTPVRYSFEQHEIYQHVNYLGTVNLVHAALQLSSFEKFIFASTMEVYGWQTQRKPFTEDIELNPASPYSVSKLAAEKYIRMAGKAYNLPFIALRPCNTYGRKFDTGFIVEYLITTMLKNETVYVGSSDAVRDLMYVPDHVNAYIKCIKSNVSSGVFNFGLGSEVTMGELASKIKDMIGFDGEIVHTYPPDYPSRPVIDPYLSLDASKARDTLGWKPKYSLNDGLKETIKYWKEKLLKG